MEMDENRSSRNCNFDNRKDMRMNDKDRLSHLPEPLLHHILSFMDMKEVVHSSLISKRWRYLWTSVRDLNFNSKLWRFEYDDYDNVKENFTYFVDSVLLLRDGSDIHSLNLDFVHHNVNDYTQIERWITYAQRHRVQLLDFASVDIPSARSLCLCDHVNTLKICGGSIPFDSKNELVLDLPVVENLTIDSCDHTGILLLTISGPKLKFLKLSHFFHEHNYKSAVKISAPNLLELIFEGHMYKDYVLEHLSTLVTAEVNTLTYFPDNVETPEALFVGRVSKILEGLSNVRSLIISALAFQACELNGVRIICRKLDYLKLIQWCDSYDVGSIVKLSESFPNLETLVFQKDKIKYEREDEDEDQDEDEDSAAGLSFKPSMFSHLKSIEVHNFEGNENELEILHFLVSNAPVLEKVSIISVVASNDKEKQMVRFSEEIQALQKASPSVSISLILKGV